MSKQHYCMCSESGSFRSYSRSVRSFRSGSFGPDFVDGSFFLPYFKGGSFRPHFWGESFRPDLYIMRKQVSKKGIGPKRPGVRTVGCFGFNGPLRQYFSLYRAVSQREGERKDKR